MANDNKKHKTKGPINIKNKKAAFDYFFVDTYTAGIVLTGTEIKSLRAGKASLVDTFCYIYNKFSISAKRLRHKQKQVVIAACK